MKTTTFLAPVKLIAPVALAWAILSGTARAQEEDFADPLGDVIADMQVAGGRLGKLLTDKPTQQKQRDAVDKLDTLIKELEQRRQQGQGGGRPDEPLNDSRIVGGPGGMGDLHDAKRTGRSWGQLPAHKREQILQSMTEGFPAHYQPLLERYYLRLAEEKPASDVVEPAAAGKAPADATNPGNAKPPATKPAASTKPAESMPKAAKPAPEKAAS